MIGRALIIAALLGAAAWAPAQDDAPARPSVLFLDLRRQEHYETYFKQFLRQMHETGFDVTRADVNAIEPADFANYNVIVYLNVPNWDDNSHGPPARFTAQLVALDDFLAAGGGVLAMSHPGPQRLPSLWAMYRPHGLEVQVATIHDPLAETATLVNAPFAYTDRLADHPVTEGVRGLWYPVYPDGGQVWNANTSPFAVDDTWTVLVETAASAWVSPYTFNMSEIDSHAPSGRIDGPVPLLAVKQVGPGRLAFCGVDGSYHIHGGLAPACEGVTMGPGLLGKPSDFEPLMLNLLHWLGEPSLASGALGGATTDEGDIAPPQLVVPPPKDSWGYWRPEERFHGVIGPRTGYSVGASTAAEYAAAARAADLDFVIFAEPLTDISEADFTRLKDECRTLSSDDLLLVAGLDCEDETGNHYVVMAPDLRWPAAGLLVPGTRKFWVLGDKPRGLAFCKYMQQNLPALVSIYRGEGGVPWWDTRCYRQAIPIETWRNGERVDELKDEYRALAAAGEWPVPVALNFMDSADQLAAMPGGEEPHTVLLAYSLDELRGKIAPRSDFRPTSWVTNGPEIEYWQWLSDRDYVANGYWWDWTRYRWAARFRVTSDAGLREVLVYDGPRLVRRFDAGGATEFEREIPLVHEQQKNLTLVVTDANGRTAWGGELLDRNHLMEHVYCSDRMNTLSYACLPSDGPYGSTVGTWPMPVMAKGPLTDDLFVALNQDMYRFPGYDGQPERHLKIIPAVHVHTDQGAEGGRVNRRILRPLATADVCIEETTFEHRFPEGVNVWNSWNNLGPIEPMQIFKGRLRYTTFTHPGHLPAPVLVEGEIEMLRDGRFSDDRAMPLHVAFAGAPYADAGYSTCIIAHTGANDVTFGINYDDRPQLQRWSAPFPTGAYGYFYHSLYGPGGLFSLTDGLQAYYVGPPLYRVNIGLPLRGRPFRAGDRFSFRYIAFAGGYDTLPSDRLPERFRDLMGLDGSPGYTVAAEQGAVTSTLYALTIDGGGAGFAGTVIPEESLPAILPVIVEGLNDRWGSVMLDRETRLWRPLAMHEGAAWAHLDLTARDPQPASIFIGHPFTCNNPELFLTLVQTAPGEFTLAVHNPTVAEVSATLTPAPWFDLVAPEALTVTVPTGDSVTLTVPKQ